MRSGETPCIQPGPGCPVLRRQAPKLGWRDQTLLQRPQVSRRPLRESSSPGQHSRLRRAISVRQTHKLRQLGGTLRPTVGLWETIARIEISHTAAPSETPGLSETSRFPRLTIPDPPCSGAPRRSRMRHRGSRKVRLGGIARRGRGRLAASPVAEGAVWRHRPPRRCPLSGIAVPEEAVLAASKSGFRVPSGVRVLRPPPISRVL